MPPAPTPKIVLVKSTSPRGSFRRAGLTFTADWRPLEVSATANLEKGVIDAAVLARLEAEKMLAVKPASATEVEAYQKAAAETAGKDPVEEVVALKKRLAELEARLMQLTLEPPAKGEKK